MVTTGVVGSGLPIANGLALAAKMRGTDQVTAVNFGDGASNIGAFHESMNLASLWQLPVVFVCQNNQWAEYTSLRGGTTVANIADRAASYSMPAITVDGNDPDAMYAAAGEAIERARTGGGPTLLEALTFRFCGHYFGDGGEYIPKAELAAAVEADPIPVTDDCSSRNPRRPRQNSSRSTPPPRMRPPMPSSGPSRSRCPIPPT